LGWRRLDHFQFAALDFLRRERNMIVVLLAHSAIETVNDPRYLDLVTRGLLWAVNRPVAIEVKRPAAKDANIKALQP
jgi:type 1 glutamine amidotransferase